jgi:hypothetical protein
MPDEHGQTRTPEANLGERPPESTSVKKNTVARLDNLCHTLVGAALGEAGLKRTTPLAMATLLGFREGETPRRCRHYLPRRANAGIRPATIFAMKPTRAAALALSGALALVSIAAAAPREVLPWVDDYPKAVGEARAKNVPIFVEAWAPW